MSATGYFPPVIQSTGLSIPLYSALLNYLLTQFQNIYGQNSYLGQDAADYQDISIRALTSSDVCSLLQMVYLNMSPQTAIGVGLSQLVLLNGLARKVASYSTVQATITGVAGTVITNGLAQDTVYGYLWTLPTPLTIPVGGSVTVTAVCQTIGAVNIPIGSLTTISTPTAGWAGVTNPSASSPGQPIEQDSTLRTRQSVSVELPSITMVGGMTAAIAAVPGVTRSTVEENDTGSIDGNGCPPHSVTAVVEGGTNLAVATAIYQQKGIGALTNGTTTQPVVDPTTGVTNNISFDRPTYVQIYVIVNAHLLPGGTTALLTAIQTNLNTYLNELQIGELVSYGALMSVAMSVNPSLTTPLVSVHSLFFGTSPSPSGTTDITMLFNQVAQTNASQITVNSV